MKKIFIYKRTCIRRTMDAKKIATYFSKNDYKIITDPKKADVIFFIGCAAVDTTLNISLNKIKELQKYDAELIVGGCVPAIDPEKLSKIFKGKKISTKNLKDIDNYFPENKVKFKDIKDPNELYYNKNTRKITGVLKKNITHFRHIRNLYAKLEENVLKNLFGEQLFLYFSQNFYMHSSKKIYYIRISWGCNSNCTYCVIPKATGPYHSKSLNECLKEFEKGLAKGYKKFALIAVDSGPYGIDISTSLPELLSKLIDIKGDYGLILHDLNPRWCVKYIDKLERIMKSQKIESIDCEIQSGNTRILKLMNRYSDTEEMKLAFKRLKKSNPNFFLSTDCITGFPSETLEEFKETLGFIKECDFDAGHLYPFALKTTEKLQNMELLSDNESHIRLKYAKKILKQLGYKVIYVHKPHLFLFYKDDKQFKS